MIASLERPRAQAPSLSKVEAVLEMCDQEVSLALTWALKINKNRWKWVLGGVWRWICKKYTILHPKFSSQTANMVPKGVPNPPFGAPKSTKYRSKWILGGVWRGIPKKSRFSIPNSPPKTPQMLPKRVPKWTPKSIKMWSKKALFFVFVFGHVFNHFLIIFGLKRHHF